MRRGATWGHVVVGLLAVVAALGLTAPPATAQDDADTTACVANRPVDDVFVGRVTSIVDEQVTFEVREVRAGDVAGEKVTVHYPTQYNARELDVGHSYLVPLVDVTTGASSRGTPKSFVDTAEIGTCGGTGGTRHVDGSAIDTGALAGAKPTLVRYGLATAAVVVAVFVLLVALGRFLDRRSRYRRPVRL